MWTRLKQLKWKGYLREAAILVVIFTVVHFWQTRNVVSGRVPELEATFLDGTRFSSANVAGKPVVLHFWATWCGVCKAEQGNVQRLANGGDVLTIATGSGDAAAVRKHLQEQGLSFPVLLDREGDLAHRFGVSAFPTTLFVSADGTIRFTEVGYTTTLGMYARRWLASL